MTRLKPGDIKDIDAWLTRCDQELKNKTGCSLTGIACHALDCREDVFRKKISSVSVGVVPIASGQGIIGGFSTAVCAIAAHIGARAFVTGRHDVAGIAEAAGKGADVILMADDHRFVALNIREGRTVDNAEATALGFVAGLDLIAGGLKNKKLLVIGCGPVGRFGVFAALKRGADVSVFDTVSVRANRLKNEIEEKLKTSITIENQFHPALKKYSYWLEATNSSGIIDETVITPQTYIAAPGMPPGVTAPAAAALGNRYLHDPLQTGVAVMVAAAAPAKIRNNHG